MIRACLALTELTGLNLLNEEMFDEESWDEGSRKAQYEVSTGVSATFSWLNLVVKFLCGLKCKWYRGLMASI